MTSTIFNDTKFITRAFDDDIVAVYNTSENELTWTSKTSTVYTTNKDPFNCLHENNVQDFYISGKYAVVSYIKKDATLSSFLNTFKIEICENNAVVFHRMVSWMIDDVSLIGLVGDIFFVLSKQPDNSANVVMYGVDTPAYSKVLKKFSDVTTLDSIAITLCSKRIVVHVNGKSYNIELSDKRRHALDLVEDDPTKTSTPKIIDGKMYIFGCKIDSNSKTHAWITRHSYNKDITSYFYVNIRNRMYVMFVKGIAEIIDIDRRIIRNVYTNKLFHLPDWSQYVYEFDKNGIRVGSNISSIFKELTLDFILDALSDEKSNILLNSNKSDCNDVCVPYTVKVKDDFVKNIVTEGKTFTVMLFDLINRVSINIDDTTSIAIANGDIASFIRKHGINEKYVVENKNGNVVVTKM